MVRSNGHDLGEMQKLLLKKVEELMLYVIEQDKKMKELQEENKKIKGSYRQIKEKLQTIKR